MHSWILSGLSIVLYSPLPTQGAELPAAHSTFERSGQGRHTVGDVEATTFDHFPASHRVQVDVAVSVLYLPAAHSAHSFDDVEPSEVPYFPAGQTGQLGDPGTSAYLPSLQELHSVLALKKTLFPTEQFKQEVMLLEGWYVPLRHGEQIGLVEADVEFTLAR
jgi:hypothetical protein